MSINQFNDAERMSRNGRNASVVEIGGFNATEQKYLFVAPQTMPEGATGIKVTDFLLLSDTATASSVTSSKEYSFQIANLTRTLNLLATAVATGTTEVTDDTVYAITPDQNQTIGIKEVLELQITKTGSPTDLSSAEVIGVLYWEWV